MVGGVAQRVAKICSCMENSYFKTPYTRYPSLNCTEIMEITPEHIFSEIERAALWRIY
jgi:hypothetical protein